MIVDKPIKYCREFYRIRFRGKNLKDAYLRACKWYATNVMSKDELQNTFAEYEKEEQSPTVVLHLYVSLAEDAVRQEHCNICKEVNKSFLGSDDCDCSNCKLHGYYNRIDRKIETKSLYYREIIDRNWE